MPIEKIKIKTIKATVEIEAQMFGIFAVHQTSFGKGTKEHKTYTLTHAPSGMSLIKASPFKSVLTKAAKLLDQHIRNGGFGSDVVCRDAAKVRKAFPKDCVAFITKLNNQIEVAPKANDINVEEFWLAKVTAPNQVKATQGELF